MKSSGSTKWIKFSDYEICCTEDGTKYIRPVSGSAPVIYDPASKPDNLATKVMNTAKTFAKDEADETIVLDLICSIGLPGFALDSSEDYVFPFGGTPAADSDLRLAGRGPEYASVFSKDYAEKYDDVCSWLKKINASVSDSCCFSAPFSKDADEADQADASACDAPLSKEADSTSLKSIAEYCISSLAGEGKLHICVHCGKIYYTEDPESITCSKACDFQHIMSDPELIAQKGYCCHLIGGG